jgi:hypothetical protein
MDKMTLHTGRAHV